MKICIPSLSRSKTVSTGKYIKDAVYYVPENQVDEYEEHNQNKVIGIPKEKDGNIAKARNYILNENNDELIVMMDDDVKAMAIYENGKRYILSEEELKILIHKYSRIARGIGTVLWGGNLLKDKIAYLEYKPLNFLTPVLGPFSVHLDNHSIRYDEDIPLKEDYDMSLQVIKQYRKILRVNKLHYIVKQYRDRNEGGCTSYRTKDRERENMFKLQKKWGKKIVKIPDDDINPILNIPIGGT